MTCAYTLRKEYYTLWVFALYSDFCCLLWLISVAELAQVPQHNEPEEGFLVLWN